MTAKIAFFTGAVADEFTGLQASILNRAEGTIDSVKFRFSDLLGKKHVQNCNRKDGIYPFMWRNNHKVKWYAYQPDAGDYAAIRDAVSTYLDIFKEPLSMTPCHKTGKSEKEKIYPDERRHKCGKALFST